jgi:hypothetical protein
VSYVVNVVWRGLFGLVETHRRGGVLTGRGLADLPLWAAWAALLTLCAVSLWLLNRRLQAREVVA